MWAAWPRSSEWSSLSSSLKEIAAVEAGVGVAAAATVVLLEEGGGADARVAVEVSWRLKEYSTVAVVCCCLFCLLVAMLFNRHDVVVMVVSTVD